MFYFEEPVQRLRKAVFDMAARIQLVRPEPRGDEIEKIKQAVDEADAVVIGAGAGLSTAAGFVYNGERFQKYFGDFSEKYGFNDMYSGGFHPYDTLEENWAFWSRNIYVNRYVKAPKRVYDRLYDLVDGRREGDPLSAPKKDYFVLTTNVDHQFQKAGFDKSRLFYTQGDYGLWQCSKPCHKRTYDNKERVVKMLVSQGFVIDAGGELLPPVKENGDIDFGKLSMTVPSDLVPYCPVCGEPMSMNLRADNTFVEDEGWHQAAERYSLFIKEHADKRIVFLEIGVGYNTPVIIKYPFWQMTAKNPDATYVCLNFTDAVCPDEIVEQSICLEGDADQMIKALI